MLVESINCQKSKPYFLFSAVIHDKHSSYDIKTQNLYTVKVKTVYKFMKKEGKREIKVKIYCMKVAYCL